MEDKGAVYIANNWSAEGRTWHVIFKKQIMRELKRQGIIDIVWNPGETNGAHQFTTHLKGPDFRRNLEICCRKDKYD